MGSVCVCGKCVWDVCVGWVCWICVVGWLQAVGLVFQSTVCALSARAALFGFDCCVCSAANDLLCVVVVSALLCVI